MGSDDYANYIGKVKVRDSDSISELREAISTKYSIPEGGFIISYVLDQTMKRIFNVNSKVEEIESPEELVACKKGNTKVTIF